ncbi:MAG: hypothetical protein MHPSP_004035, partial [Paramarteilia canceri]
MIVKRNSSHNRKTLNSKPYRSDFNKIKYYGNIELNQMKIISTGESIDPDSLELEMMHTYWYLSNHTGKYNNASEKQITLNRCREHITSSKSNIEMTNRRRLFLRDNFLFETNRVKLYRMLKEKVVIENNVMNLSEESKIDKKLNNYYNIADEAKDEFHSFWDTMWTPALYKALNQSSLLSQSSVSSSNPLSTTVHIEKSILNNSAPDEKLGESQTCTTLNEFLDILKLLPNWKATGPD